MKVWPVLALFLLTTCRSAPPREGLILNDYERLRWLMGENDWHVLEIQRGAGDPIEPEYVRRHLDALAANFNKVAALHPYGPEKDKKLHDWAQSALEVIADMKVEWTAANRQEQWEQMKMLCSSCHNSFDRGLDQPAAHRWSSLTGVSSWEACGKCHAEVFKEWEPGLHAQAWKDATYRQSAGNPPKMTCRPCHSMEPILFREISTEVGYRPVYRGYNQDEGVSCVACHLLSDGSVAAGRNHPGAPCKPAEDLRLRDAAYCGSCHNPSHLAYDEWKTSQAAKMGVDCRSCHMPEKQRLGADGKSKRGFDHTFLGGNSPEIVRLAVATACSVEKGEVSIRVSNKSSHKFPGEVPSRAFRIRVMFTDREGKKLFDEYLQFRRALKGEIGWKDNRLRPDETRDIRQKIPEGSTAVSVQFFFQQSLMMHPKGWIDLGRWDSEIER